MTTIRIMSDGYTINTKKVLKVFKSFFVEKLKKTYGSGYEIVWQNTQKSIVKFVQLDDWQKKKDVL